ncbi:MAG: DUF2585 family protein [Acidobacteriota bacterium]|nr:DUF2585 family protein [Acidobacteriota bacterium]MDH3529150.1 DUF2585 family protein [Acidobacteriota bacterium]
MKPEPKKGLIQTDNWSHRTPWVAMAACVVIMAAVLNFQGRLWWCRWDSPIWLWSSDVWSKHNSQHLFDPYMFTHLLHGVAFYWLGRLLFQKRISFAWLLFTAVFVESFWEVVENSAYIINRYRAATASLDYFGDSILNSVGDVFACFAGFLIAFKLRLWKSLVLFVLVEMVLILVIKDSLLINILMLIYPIEAIKVWQTGY